MPLELKNNNYTILVDHPFENYCGSRFDWTGKITQLHFQNTSILSSENLSNKNEHGFGRGLYNEFSIDFPLGFKEAEMGEWFHKIGVGLLQKDGHSYDFNKVYKIKPAEFSVLHERDKIIISCNSESVNGFAYRLNKQIELHKNTFSIRSELENTGEKEIVTNEYNHNFIGINNGPIGENIILKFPFQVNPKELHEIVNPGNKVKIASSDLEFNAIPQEPFFFSNLSGHKLVDAAWELHDLNSKIGIRETGNFQTQSINVWGSKHVISPELFIKIHISPGESKEWTRTYEVFEL